MRQTLCFKTGCEGRAATQAKRVTKPMLVKLANWLRWRRLAKASPRTGWFTQGARSRAKSRYCKTPSRLLTAAAANHAATTQGSNWLLSSATRRPTAAITHTVTSAANKPEVKAASTTSGTHSTEAASAMNHAPPANTHPCDVEVAGSIDKSTTNNKAQAPNIQLSNKGTTPVEGLLAKGLSHGKTKHSSNKTLRAATADFSKESMGWIFLHPSARTYAGCTRA